MEKKGFTGQGRDLAPLTEMGKQQAKRASQDPALDGVELVLSSPYTRALQTATIVSRRRDMDIQVEVDLHEWLPDLSFSYKTGGFSDMAEAICLANGGLCPPGSTILYEEFSAVRKRVMGCLEKYSRYDKVAAVTHGFVIRQFTGTQSRHCGISIVQF